MRKRTKEAGMSDWTIFGERLSHIMREYDVSLRELSRRTGITVTTLCRYANCKRIPRATEILKCADALSVTCDYLLGLSDGPHLTGKGERIVGKRCGEPEQKTGRWMEHIFNDGIMGRRPRALMCSQCNTLSLYRTNFCSSCGAEMIQRGGDSNE